MTAFLMDYGLFLLKAVTIVAAIVAVIVAIAAVSRREHGPHGLTVEKLNDKYARMANLVRRAALDRAAWRKHERAEKKAGKSAKKAAKTRHRVYVLDFHGDIRATAVENLREEVSAVVAVAGPDDEVVVRLENAGGTVQDHGLGASQLQRFRDRGIPLTVIVDKVAASGGYMMACIADKIVAAPFAVIGSIGVLAQLPNFHRFLEARGIDFEQISAGKYKRTLSLFGKNTEEDRQKMKEELEDVHGLFKELVGQNRPELDVEQIATGEYWYGSRAKEMNLVDEIGSSDDYLMRAAEDADILSVTYKGRQTLVQRLQSALGSVAAVTGLRGSGGSRGL